MARNKAAAAAAAVMDEWIPFKNGDASDVISSSVAKREALEGVLRTFWARPPLILLLAVISWPTRDAWKAFEAVIEKAIAKREEADFIVDNGT